MDRVVVVDAEALKGLTHAAGQISEARERLLLKKTHQRTQQKAG
jgi:hypothetical protein